MFKPGYVCIHCDFKTVSRDEIEDHERAHQLSNEEIKDIIKEVKEKNIEYPE